MQFYLNFSFFAVDILPFSTTVNTFQRRQYSVVSTDHVFEEKYLQIAFSILMVFPKKAYIAGKLPWILVNVLLSLETATIQA